MDHCHRSSRVARLHQVGFRHPHGCRVNNRTRYSGLGSNPQRLLAAFRPRFIGAKACRMFETSDHRLADEGPHSLNPLKVADAHTKTWIPFSTYPDITTILEDRAGKSVRTGASCIPILTSHGSLRPPGATPVKRGK